MIFVPLQPLYGDIQLNIQMVGSPGTANFAHPAFYADSRRAVHGVLYLEKNQIPLS